MTINGVSSNVRISNSSLINTTTDNGVDKLQVNGSGYFNGSVQAFNSSTPAGASYGYSGAVRTDGASATLISAAYHDEFEEPALATADVFLAVSGNNALLQVQGVAATSINWNSLLEYRKVT